MTDRNTTYKPVLAITMGDPSGIGPEITVRAIMEDELLNECRPLVVGNAHILRKTVKELKLNRALEVHSITNVNDAIFSTGMVNVFDIQTDYPENIPYGVVNAQAGDIAFRSVKKAIDLAMEGDVDGTVTGPINKASIHAAGHKFSGHTEIYAHFTGTTKYAMLLADEKIKVIHVSTHVPLRKACDLVKKTRILDVIDLLNDALKGLGYETPRIGVAGLNPHASDEGLFGFEEEKEILPAVDEARSYGLDISGPYPPDTLFSLAAGGKFDGCVAMYHDQGHIPFKMVGFVWDEKTGKMKSVKGVNITLGLPVIRTSVDHGTAFEIAGKGIASPDALLYAIEYAVLLYKNNTKN